MNGAVLTDAIREIGTAKEIARICGCSVWTAARYMRGETMPDPIRLARLMAASRNVAQAMLRLAGLDDLSMDMEEARLRGELRRLQEKRGRVADGDVGAAVPGGGIASDRERAVFAARHAPVGTVQGVGLGNDQ